MPAHNPLFLRDEALDQGLELLFFVQAALGGAAKAALERHGLGLGGYRVLYLIARRPGTTLAELGLLLGASKQSLSRLVKELQSASFVVQETTTRDRRKRLLRITAEAEACLGEVGDAQRRQLRGAFKKAGGEAVDGFRRVLLELIDEPARRALRPNHL
ncbi:MAG TPA: MarR family winged helix-turn-helix transcriptional regulator [Geminicoccaceae bacterium]|nr:MarR family winged helix-turn-helix transcriptional regulator [Geminicoccaceae bacterium]